MVCGGQNGRREFSSTQSQRNSSVHRRAHRDGVDADRFVLLARHRQALSLICGQKTWLWTLRASAAMLAEQRYRLTMCYSWQDAIPTCTLSSRTLWTSRMLQRSARGKARRGDEGYALMWNIPCSDPSWKASEVSRRERGHWLVTKAACTCDGLMGVSDRPSRPATTCPFLCWANCMETEEACSGSMLCW